MTDERALLAAICAEPEEDTPRLVYADWLEEHGDDGARARAAFIRTQIERYRMPPEDDDADTAERRLALEDREERLKRSPTGGPRPWAHPYHPPPPEGTPKGVGFGGHGPAQFVRGFRVFAQSTPERFVEVGPGFFDAHPVHRLHCEPPSLTAAVADRFFALPWLKRVRRLEMPFIGPIGERFFECEHLAGLEVLSIRGTTTFSTRSVPGTISGLKTLAVRLDGSRNSREDVAARVSELLSGDSLTDFTFEWAFGNLANTLHVLTQCARFANVARLTLSPSNRGTPEVPCVETLTTAPFWRGLRSLGFTGRFQDADAAEFAEAAPPAALRRLELPYHRLTEEGLRALSWSPGSSSVTHLTLRGGLLTDARVKLLAEPPTFRRLATLDLEGSGIGPRGVRAIAEAPWAAGLVRLNLSQNPIKRAGVEALLGPGRFPRLRRLELVNSVGPDDLKIKLRARFGDAVRFNVV